MSSALLLAAGKATRLKGIRDQYAKACVPIQGTTPLRFMMQSLAAHGVDDFWINLHWKAEQVRQHAIAALPDFSVQAEADERPESAQINFITEEQLLGTGGTLLECAHRRGAVPDLVVNAKQFGDVDFAGVLQQAPGTLVLHTQSSLADFGGLHFQQDGLITGLLRKTEASQQTPSAAGTAVFTGICRPDPGWLPYLQQARRDHPNAALCMLRHGMFPALADGLPARAWLHHGEWFEISTPDRVQALQQSKKPLPA